MNWDGTPNNDTFGKKVKRKEIHIHEQAQGQNIKI